MREAVVLGTGGHARVVLSILAACGDRTVLGAIDLGTPREGEQLLGVPVIGGREALERLRGQDQVDLFLAIGDNGDRRRWWEEGRAMGLALPTLVSPHAIVDVTARIGGAVIICARAFVGPDAVIGDNVLLNTASIVEHESVVGSHSHLAPSATLAGRSRVGGGCFVGAGATIIDGVSVTDGVTIGAGAVVVHSIDEPGTYVGVPARAPSRRGNCG